MADDENIVEGEAENENEEKENPAEEEMEDEIENESGKVEKEESTGKLTIAESVANRLKEQPSLISRASKMSRSRKARERARNTCVLPELWNCEQEPLWRIYLQVHADEARKRTEELADKYGEFHRARPADDLPRLPCAQQPSTGPICQKLNVLNRREPAGLPSTRLWESIRQPRAGSDAASIGTTCSDSEWPRLYPCSRRDVIRQRKVLARKLKMKRLGALPCKVDEVDSPESSEDERMQELANLKELGHARIPRTLARKLEVPLVDRACGERTGLLDPDHHALHELATRKQRRVYASLCLRGLTGMHLAELGRVRERTWKFCLHPALVALLVKTQLRYKYAWSANVDYIYEHGWLLFLHVGQLNLGRNQRFDDLLVYNYKYSVELELVQELAEVTVDPSVGFGFLERSLRKQWLRPRKELTRLSSGFGEEREQDAYRLNVHKSTRELEKWFDGLDLRYTNCVYRTTRFSLAFWQDGPFWYMYNPYRCDEYGFWDDAGYACIVKFCTRTALKRHLMILTLRAYAYAAEIEQGSGEARESEKFAVQIYQLIYHACQIHNVKLYTRGPFRPRQPKVEKRPCESCTFDPLAHLAPKVCKEARDDEKNDDSSEKIERSQWVRDMKITWAKIPAEKTENGESVKWHMFDVVEPRRLYVLWGDIHISDRRFAPENRNRQAGACYAVCAGMVLTNAPEYWSPEVLNAIVMCGDRFYSQRKLRLQQQLGIEPSESDSWDASPREQFRIGDVLFDLQAQPARRGRLFAHGDGLWSSLERHFQQPRPQLLVLDCESSSLAVFKHCGAYYAYDARSYGPPVYGRGRAGSYLLRAACLADLVRCLVLAIGSPECSGFTLRPLEILQAVDTERWDACGAGRTGGENRCPGEIQAPRPACPLEDERRKARARPRRGEGGRTIDTVLCARKDDFD